MPITDRSQLKESGFAQVRAALQRFEGTVVSAEFDKYPPRRDDDGNPMPEKEYLEITCTGVEVLEVTEELSMDIEEWNWRINCSEAKGTTWDKFLESADNAKLQIPDELEGKRIVWAKVTIPGSVPMYDASNFIIESVKAAPKATPKVSPKVPAPVQSQKTSPSEESPETGDLMEVALDIAVGRTEAMFRSKLTLDDRFHDDPLLPLAKSGLLTKSWIDEGKLVLVGSKYQKPD